jgi:hypothetical protein
MRAARIVGIVLVAAVLGYAAAQWLSPREAPPLETPPFAVPDAALRASLPETPLASPTGELRIASGGRIAIDGAALDPDRPVVVRLELGAVQQDDTPRPVRVASLDGRVFDAQGSLGGERQEAQVEIDPAFLTPGLYMVQVETTEQTPLQLRRYVIEVR